MTLYVTSTSHGDVLIACGRVSPATSKTRLETSFRQECERLASTLRISGARALGVLPLKTGVASARDALTTLSNARKLANANLSSTSRATQIAAASGLATSYETAANQVARLRPALGIRGPRAGVVLGLQAEGRAFTALAAAGTSGSAENWKTSAETVRMRDQQLRDDLKALDAALAGKPYALGS
jgi:hypothetical protein